VRAMDATVLLEFSENRNLHVYELTQQLRDPVGCTERLLTWARVANVDHDHAYSEQ
jgi:hypothetical protein